MKGGWQLILLGILIGAGAALRIWLAIAAYTSTFDTGTVALMAMDISQGRDYPLFFYGQSYFGALEAYVGALLISVVGHHELVVSAAVIGFSLLWIISTFFLFSALFGSRAGLVAALIVAIPGYQVTWYNVASYGGYPVVFSLGSMVLGLAVIMRKRDPVGGELWVLSVLLGALSALGLWTHLTVAPFVLSAGLILVRLINRENVKAFALAGLLAGLGLIPGYCMSKVYTGSDTASFQVTLDHMVESVSVLFQKNLPELLFWNADVFPGWVIGLANGATWFAVISGALVFCYTVCRFRSHYLLVPFIFILLFLCMYLLHEMATVKAPRYIMPLYILVLCTIFAYPVARLGGRYGVAACTLPVVFVLAQLGGTLAYGILKKPVKEATLAEAEAVVDGALALGCDYVQMVGGYVYGHLGQKYSFLGKGQTRFVSVFDERHQPSAQAADAAERPGYTCEQPVVPKLRASFDALGLEQVQESNQVFRATSLWQPPRKSIQGLQPAALFDRDRATVLEGKCKKDDALIIDLGQTRRLVGLWMMAPDPLQTGLPESYRMSVSEDRMEWEIVAECVSRLAVSYRSGPQAYFKGYFGMQETVLSAEGRYLKIEFLRGQGRTADRWALSELVIFEAREDLNRPPADELENWLSTYRDHFVIADRWMSARVIRDWGEGSAYPRYNSKFLPSLQSRNLPATDKLVVAVDEGLVEETRELLGAERIVAEAAFGTYHLFECTGGEGLFWNGHFLVK